MDLSSWTSFISCCADQNDCQTEPTTEHLCRLLSVLTSVRTMSCLSPTEHVWVEQNNEKNILIYPVGRNRHPGVHGQHYERKVRLPWKGIGLEMIALVFSLLIVLKSDIFYLWPTSAVTSELMNRPQRLAKSWIKNKNSMEGHLEAGQKRRRKAIGSWPEETLVCVGIRGWCHK